MVCLSLSIIWWQLAAVTSIHRKPVSLPSTMEVSTDTRYRYRSNPSRNLNLCWLSQSVSNTARWSTSLVYMYGSSICRAGAQNKDGFVYFGMHGALPVYSLKRSSVEGKIMIRWLSYIMPSDSTGLWSSPHPNVYDACPMPLPVGFERYWYWGIGYWPILASIGWYWCRPNTFFSNCAQYWADSSLWRRLTTHDDLISRNSLWSRQLPQCEKSCALGDRYNEA